MTGREGLSQSMALMDHVESQVVFGDTKASLLFTANAILLAALGLVVRDGALGEDLTIAGRSLVLLAGAALVAGLLLALWVVRPSRHFAPPPWRLDAARYRSDVFFLRSIAEFDSGRAYEEELGAMDVPGLQGAALRATYGKSKVANAKFRCLWFAVTATMLAIAFAALAAVVEVVSRV